MIKVVNDSFYMATYLWTLEAF
ncbi:hypothetical protein CBM2586_A10272 [Cupriavidus phytorum]|uniref:Uncharacterized protein n=1 Tax=Cupriavidus taiwanensis TaxID=164546 RepID=A0A975WPD7_9BURK|nr:hypothetical protein CBM2586_A10272 [Cupriavidus taiwanensis]